MSLGWDVPENVSVTSKSITAFGAPKEFIAYATEVVSIVDDQLVFSQENIYWTSVLAIVYTYYYKEIWFGSMHNVESVQLIGTDKSGNVEFTDTLLYLNAGDYAQYIQPGKWTLSGIQ